MIHHRTIVGRGSPLVERDLVDAPLLFEVGEKADERLADGPRADHMHDVFRRHIGRGLYAVARLRSLAVTRQRPIVSAAQPRNRATARPRDRATAPPRVQSALSHGYQTRLR